MEIEMTTKSEENVLEVLLENAARELEDQYNWEIRNYDPDTGDYIPFNETEFCEVLTKHLLGKVDLRAALLSKLHCAGHDLHLIEDEIEILSAMLEDLSDES